MKRHLLSIIALLLGSVITVAAPAGDITEKEALDFLYKYMLLPDRLDYSESFYRQNVDAALKARREMPWGMSVPKREFMHFVLPVRVNNENLDSSRMVFYRELAPRVKNLSMKDAALEINHWLHEKVTYRPSDPRTSSPLVSVSKGFGRCGEESTFGVAAFRAMGIPARQIYTPRWAHTDDNHAWVEVWIDGKWYFLGACEPEPILNMAWFNAPAARGMLMNTDAFGNYTGDEEVLAVSPFYTKINVTENYAPVAQAKVKVVDRAGNPVENAEVHFSLYNYAEFYPLAKKFTDASGNASFTSGLGDLLVWVSDGKNFGIRKISVGKDDEVIIPLDKDDTSVMSFDYDIVPPQPSGNLPAPTKEQVDENNRRKEAEDSIRNAYTSTFYTLETGAEYAADNGYDPKRTGKLLRDAYGNHETITDFLDGAGVTDKEKALRLLEVMAVKDLADVSSGVLLDAFSTPKTASPLFDRYVMNPRIAFEMLTPYRGFFHSVMSKGQRKDWAKNPTEWVKWVAKNIEVSPSQNPKSFPISPESVWKHRKDIDPHSRDIFFVAGARSLGIPARIDEVTGKVQYSADGENWTDVRFTAEEPVSVRPSGTLRLTFDPVRHIVDPKYYIHFSLSKIENGFPRLLEFSEEDTWKSALEKPRKMDAGKYMLVTGQRMADGTVLSHSQIFDVDADRETVVPLVLRQDTTGAQVIGNFNAENIYRTADGVDKSVLSTTGRGYYVIGVITPNSEPSSHALNDISACRKELEEWGRPIIFLFKDKEEMNRFKPETFPSLPSTVSFGIDPEGKIAAEIGENMRVNMNDTPVIIIADTFNRVVFMSNSYTINTGEKLLDIIHKLK